MNRSLTQIISAIITIFLFGCNNDKTKVNTPIDVGLHFKTELNLGMNNYATIERRNELIDLLIKYKRRYNITFYYR